VKTRHHGTSKGALLVILGAASCGAPSFGSGGDGSGGSGEFGDEPGRWLTDGSTDDGDASDPTRGGGGGSSPGADDGSESGDEPVDEPTPDVGSPSGGPTTTCSCGGSEVFPNVWLAEASAGRVRKLDAESMQTLAVYATNETSTTGRPATVAVSIDGDAIAVANQDGNVVKIWTRPELCNPGMNGAAGLQTSVGDHALPWGMEDCIDWVRPTDFTVQIPVAWGAGSLDPVSCDYEEQAVWTAGCNEATDVKSSALRMDPDTGVITDVVPLSGFPCDSAVPTLGATDRDGAFWVATTEPGMSRLARISDDGLVMLVEQPPIVAAGLAIDADGGVWLSAREGSAGSTAARYTPGIAMWDLVQDEVVRGRSGIVQDRRGRLWLNYDRFGATQVTPGGTFIDADSLQVGPQIAQPCGGGSCEGISIDFAGRIWTTSQEDQRVYRFDPNTGAVVTLGGMRVSGYSSDSTGWALQNAACAGI
jgi:streptogramin lyase